MSKYSSEDVVRIIGEFGALSLSGTHDQIEAKSKSFDGLLAAFDLSEDDVDGVRRPKREDAVRIADEVQSLAKTKANIKKDVLKAVSVAADWFREMASARKVRCEGCNVEIYEDEDFSDKDAGEKTHCLKCHLAA